jgi:hypothetical protein
MMTNGRMLLLALLAVLAAGAVLSAPAIASPYEFEIEGKAVLTSTSIEGTSGLLLLAGTIGGSEARIECPEDTLTGDFEAEGLSKDTLLLKKCIATKPTGCTASLTIEAKVTDRLLESGEVPEAELTGAGAGEELAKITLEGCTLTGTYALSGKQICELPKSQEELTEHEFVCKKAASKLKLGGNTASLSNTEDVETSSGKKWQVGALERVWYVEKTRLGLEQKLKTTATLPSFLLSSKKLKAIISCKKMTLPAASAINPAIEVRMFALELAECTGAFNQAGCALEAPTITTSVLEGFLENGRFIKFENTGAAQKLAKFKVVKVGAEACGETGEWTVSGSALLAKLREPEAEIKARKLFFEKPANSSLVMKSPTQEDKTEVSLEAEIAGIEIASGLLWSVKRP